MLSPLARGLFAGGAGAAAIADCVPRRNSATSAPSTGASSSASPATVTEEAVQAGRVTR